MTINDLPDIENFATDARRWLSSVAQPRAEVRWGEGSDSVAVLENWTPEQEKTYTGEIQHNITAERVLGLPKELRQ